MRQRDPDEISPHGVLARGLRVNCEAASLAQGSDFCIELFQARDAAVVLVNLGDAGAWRTAQSLQISTEFQLLVERPQRLQTRRTNREFPERHRDRGLQVNRR